MMTATSHPQDTNVLDLHAISSEDLDMMLTATLSPWRLTKQLTRRVGTVEANNVVEVVREDDGSIQAPRVASLLLSSEMEPAAIIDVIRMSKI